MSHVPSHTARATDHAVRRYAERILGLNTDGLDDPAALTRARAQGMDCDGIRRRLAALGGVILRSGMHSGIVVVPAERMSVRVTAGAVVTVTRSAARRPMRPQRRAA